MEQTEQQEMSTIRWFGEDQSNATSLTSMANIITVSTETSFADYQNSTATSSRTIVEDYQPLLSPLIDDKSIDLSSISHTDSEDIEMRCPLLSDFPDNRSNFSERRATISVVRQSADDTGRLVTNWAKRSVVADVLSNDVPPCSASMHEQGRRMIHCLIQNVRSNCLPYHAVRVTPDTGFLNLTLSNFPSDVNDNINVTGDVTCYVCSERMKLICYFRRNEELNLYDDKPQYLIVYPCMRNGILGLAHRYCLQKRLNIEDYKDPNYVFSIPNRATYAMQCCENIMEFLKMMKMLLLFMIILLIMGPTFYSVTQMWDSDDQQYVFVSILLFIIAFILFTSILVYSGRKFVSYLKEWRKSSLQVELTIWKLQTLN